MKIYNSAEFLKLHVDEREANGASFDRMTASDRRAAVLGALRVLCDKVPSGFEFKATVVANMLGTDFLWSAWLASDIIHGCSIMKIERVRGWQRFSVFVTP